MNKETLYRFCMLLPLIGFLAIFCLWPLATLLRISFLPGGSLTNAVGFTFDHYVRFFTTSYYIGVLVYTVKLSILVMPLVIIISYPIAYFIAFGRMSRKITFLIMTAMICPMFITEPVVAYGLRLLLSDSGVINYILLTLRLVSKPLRIMYTDLAIIIGLVYTQTPYAVLILLSNLTGIDRRCIEAAKTLNANNLRAFLYVTLPLSKYGIAAASIISFMWTMSSFVMPALLGSGAQMTISMAIERQFLFARNWPFGATISSILIMFMLVGVTGYRKVAR